MSETVEMKFDENGKLIIDFNGFKGKLCVSEMKKLDAMMREEGVHLSDVDVKLKPEAHQEVHDTSKEKRTERA